MRAGIVGTATLDITGTPDHKLESGHIQVSFGGTAADMACLLADMGVEARLLTVLNSSVYASMTAQHLRGSGVELLLDEDDEMPDAIESTHTDMLGNIITQFATRPAMQHEFTAERLAELASDMDILVADTSITLGTLERLRKLTDKPIYLVACAGQIPEVMLDKGVSKIFLFEYQLEHLSNVELVTRETVLDMKTGAPERMQAASMLMGNGDVVLFHEGRTKYVRLDRRAAVSLRDAARAGLTRHLGHYAAGYLYARHAQGKTPEEAAEGAASAAAAESVQDARQAQQRMHSVANAVSGLAHTDNLTGIQNRTGALAQIKAAMAAQDARGQGEGLSIMILDLDHFKSVNDTFGHLEGDEVLRKACAQIKPLLRTTDVFARWGGEEFVVMIQQAPVEVALRIAERIRETVAANVRCGPEENPRNVTMSIGIGIRQPGESLEAWLERADTALYAAKRNGRNRVEVGDTSEEASKCA